MPPASTPGSAFFDAPDRGQGRGIESIGLSVAAGMFRTTLRSPIFRATLFSSSFRTSSSLRRVIFICWSSWESSSTDFACLASSSASRCFNEESIMFFLRIRFSICWRVLFLSSISWSLLVRTTSRHLRWKLSSAANTWMMIRFIKSSSACISLCTACEYSFSSRSSRGFPA